MASRVVNKSDKSFSYRQVHIASCQRPDDNEKGPYGYVLIAAHVSILSLREAAPLSH
jgi:hypothetical protein